MILLSGFTADPVLGPYLRGALLLNRIDLHTPIDQWLDLLYALWADAPHEVLAKARKVIDQHAATIAPDRDTWGTLPEQVAQMGDFANLADQ